jgi:hypothetical protein
MDKPWNNKAWLLILPVFLLVAFNAIIPLMTVVNYSVQDTFGNNEFFWNGVGWYVELLDPSSDLGGRFYDSLLRNFLFSAIILAIEVPLGILVALSMPKKGWQVSAVLVILALPLLVPWNVVGTMWQIFARGDIGLFGYVINALGIDYNYTNGEIAAWFTIIIMDVWHWTSLVALLCRSALDPGCLLSGGEDRWRLALGGVPRDRAAQNEPRAVDRRAAALHGQLHDLYRALRGDGRGPRQFDDGALDRTRQDRARPVRSRQGCGALDRLQPHHPHGLLGVLYGDDKG